MTIFKCFSFTENYSKLFTFKNEDDNPYKIFNGIRALSIFWVILGHDYLIRFRLPANINSIPLYLPEAGMLTLIPSAYFAVDVFFFMGGLLAAVLGIDKL